MQGEDILRRFERLLTENISVYVAASMPTLATNSTDLEILEEKGNYLTLVMHPQLQYCKRHLRETGLQGLVWCLHGFTGQARCVH